MKTRLTYALTAILTMATLAGCSSDDDDKYDSPDWLVGTSWKSNGRNFAMQDGEYYRWVVFTSKSKCEMFYKDELTGSVADKESHTYYCYYKDYVNYVMTYDANEEPYIVFCFTNNDTRLVPTNTSLNYYYTRQ